MARLLAGAVGAPLGGEVLGVCSSGATGFPQVLAAIAFQVIVGGSRCGLFTIFPDVVPRELSPALRHVVLVPPFLWEDDLRAQVFDYKTVAWLLAVPITEDERQCAEDRGSEALQTLFVDARIDIFDPARTSVPV